MGMKHLIAAAALILAANAHAEGPALAQAKGTAQALSGGSATQVLGTSFDGGAPQDPSEPVQSGIANGDGTAPRSNMKADIKLPDAPETAEGEDVPTPGEIQGENAEKKPTKWDAVKAELKQDFMGMGIWMMLVGFMIGGFGGVGGALIGGAIGAVVGTAVAGALYALNK
jgi:hypothetical protein